MQYSVLKVRVFQLGHNCKVDLRTSDPCKRHAENQRGSKKALEMVNSFFVSSQFISNKYWAAKMIINFEYLTLSALATT